MKEIKDIKKKSEVQSRKYKDRRQKSEVRRPKSEVGKKLLSTTVDLYQSATELSKMVSGLGYTPNELKYFQSCLDFIAFELGNNPSELSFIKSELNRTDENSNRITKNSNRTTTNSNWESSSFQSQLTGTALKGRKITARGNALGLNDIMNLIAPRLNISQGDEFAWGKNKTLRADRNRLAHLEETEKNRSIFTANICLERHPELDSGSHATDTVAFGERFLTVFGMTVTDKTTRLAVRNRLTHLEATHDNSNRQRRDAEFSIVNLNYKNTTIMEFFSISLRQLTEDRKEASYNIYLN